jgi:hypothetical protein
VRRTVLVGVVYIRELLGQATVPWSKEGNGGP